MAWGWARVVVHPGLEILPGHNPLVTCNQERLQYFNVSVEVIDYIPIEFEELKRKVYKKLEL